MAYLKPKPPPFQPGMRTFGTADLNRILEAVHRQVTGGNGVNIDSFGDRLVVNASDVGNAYQQVLALFVVLVEYDDFLECCPINTSIDDGGSGQEKSIPTTPIYDASFCADVPAEQRIYVAKPWMLQRAVFEGAAVGGVEYGFYGVNSTDVYPPYMDHAAGVRRVGPVDESSFSLEYITPAYIVGEIILAVLTSTAYDDPNDHDSAMAEVRNPQKLCWQDLNCAGRIWLPVGSVLTGAKIFAPNTTSIYAADGNGHLFNYWSRAEYDTGSYWNSFQPDRLTIQEDGDYLIGASLLWNVSPGATGMRNMTLEFGNSVVSRSISDFHYMPSGLPNSPMWLTTKVVTTARMVTGDYLSLYFAYDVGGVTFYGSSSGLDSFGTCMWVEMLRRG